MQAPPLPPSPHVSNLQQAGRINQSLVYFVLGGIMETLNEGKNSDQSQILSCGQAVGRETVQAGSG